MMHVKRSQTIGAAQREVAVLATHAGGGHGSDVSICPSCGCHLHHFGPFDFGNIAIDDRGDIVFEGIVMDLPKSQHVIVEALMRAKGRGLTRGLLANALGGDLDESGIPKYIERARRSFRQISPAFDQIAALRGFGAYRWDYRSFVGARTTRGGQSIDFVS